MDMGAATAAMEEQVVTGAAMEADMALMAHMATTLLADMVFLW